MLKVKEFKNRVSFIDNTLKKEYEYLINKKYKEISDREEQKNNRYFKKCLLQNTKTKEMLNMNKDIIKDFNNYKYLTYLKCKEIDRISREEDLEPIFITLTNPSEFHPFLTSKDKKTFKGLNSNFKFFNIENRIDESYENINSIFREFYKNVKKRENKEMKFIKVIEPHSSLICHLHCIFYIKKGTYLKVVKKFNTIKKKHNLTHCQIDRLKESKGSSYIIKYLLKNYKNEDIKNFNGYKKNHKIRIFTMSNLQLSTSIFKKLYYNNQKLNKKIIEQIKKDKLKKYHNLYDFYTKNTTVKVVNENNEIIKTHNYNDVKKRFIVYKQIIKEDKEKKEVIKEYSKTIQIKSKDLKELLKKNKEEDNRLIFKIKNKLKDKNNKLIFEIDVIKKINIYNDIKTDKILNFCIYDKKEKKEIYNIKDFILIKLI